MTSSTRTKTTSLTFASSLPAFPCSAREPPKKSSWVRLLLPLHLPHSVSVAPLPSASQLAKKKKKKKASFKAFDLDGDGFISFDELSQMFTSAWLAGYSPILTQDTDDETKREIREFSVECAINMARSVMSAIDVNGDGDPLSSFLFPSLDLS